jgi:hypothetical protein
MKLMRLTGDFRDEMKPLADRGGPEAAYEFLLFRYLTSISQPFI